MVTSARSQLGDERGCWRQKTGLEQKMILFVTFLLLLSVSLIIALAVTISQKVSQNSTPLPEYQTCSTAECIKTANSLLSAMNQAASPCDDFYEYACGGWMESTKIPDDKGRWGSFDELRDELSENCVALLAEPIPVPTLKGAVDNSRAFYQDCADTETWSTDKGTAALIEILYQNVGAPFIGTTRSNRSLDWLERITSLRKDFGLNLLMTFQVSTDIKAPEGNIIYLDQALSFGLGRLILKDHEKESNKVFVDAYKSYIKSTICLITANITEFNCEDPTVDQDLSNLIKFESDLAKLTKDPVDRRNPNVWYNKLTIGELQDNFTLTPSIKWEDYVNKILEETGLSVNESTEIVVKEQEFLKKMIDLVDATDKGVVEDYLAWRLLQSIGPYSSKAFRENEFHFLEVTTGIKKQNPITDKCFSVTNSYFGYAVGSLYVQKHFSKEAKKDMETMEENVAKAFRKLLDENEWMDKETKEASRLKLTQMEGMIAYPDWIEKPDELNKYYDHLNSSLVKGEFMTTLKNVLKSSSLKNLKELTGKNNRTYDWISEPTIVNAFYSPSANTITFPAGILQPPFYQHNTINALNYGAIAYVIGHEITHGYDDQGSEYNGVGKLESWWSVETRNNYNKNKECIIAQYSNVEVKINGNKTLNLNGNQTIGENIADNGGIREAFQAYLLTGESDTRLPGLENIDHKKLFFLAAANIWCTKYRPEELENQINNGVHSPGQYRATIPLANTAQFAEVFDCKKGSNMNPNDKCVLW